MIAPRPVLAIATADFRERTRRYSFFLALLFAIFLGYATATGKIFLQFDGYRGVYTSGWTGTLVALVITCFVSLVGFYVVKNSVERDRSTGVGQILAATPLSKAAYAFGKFLSNFAVLSSMVAILALGALATQFWAAEEASIDPWALLSPFLLLALPTIALTAALALSFEMLPLLRGGFGNVAWFFLWTFGLAAPITSKRPWLDPTGIIAVMNSLVDGARRYVPDYHGGMAFQIDVGQHINVVEAWRWHGIVWSASSVLLRLMWFAVACAIVAGAAFVFDRFDTARSGRPARPARKSSSATSPQQESLRPSAVPSEHIHLTPLADRTGSNAFARIFLAELRLALFGRRWWWYAVAIGFLIAEFSAPLEASRGPILASAWMWAVFVWSPMGARESRFSTRPLLFCCANIVPQQFLGCLLAGISVAFLTGAGTVVRLAIAGNSPGLLAWLAGALVLPSLALLLGVSSGTSKPFEGLLTTLWYIGPMNHTPGLDFTGAANGLHTISYAMVLLGLTVAFLLVALSMRAIQLRSL